MLENIGALDWLVIAALGAFGFGVVRFMLAVAQEKREERERERDAER